jgi:hypothetical protein
LTESYHALPCSHVYAFRMCLVTTGIYRTFPDTCDTRPMLWLGRLLYYLAARRRKYTHFQLSPETTYRNLPPLPRVFGPVGAAFDALAHVRADACARSVPFLHHASCGSHVIEKHLCLMTCVCMRPSAFKSTAICSYRWCYHYKWT